MKEYYRIQYWSQYCTPKSIIGSADFNTIEAANKEYNRVTQLGYRTELAKITIIK